MSVKCPWCAEEEVEELWQLCERCQREPDAVEMLQAYKDCAEGRHDNHSCAYNMPSGGAS